MAAGLDTACFILQAQLSRAVLGWAERSEAGAECRSLVGGSSISAVSPCCHSPGSVQTARCSTDIFDQDFCPFLNPLCTSIYSFTVVIRVYLLYII